MIKIGCAFILSLFFACSVSAQQVIGNKKDSIPKNCIYAEGGEYAERTALDGFYYSVNYARVFHEKDDIGSVRIGFGYLPGSYTFPMEGSQLIGRRRNFLEVGLGIIPFVQSITQYASPGGSQFYGLQDRQVWNGGINFFLKIGYCFIPARRNKLMFSIGVAPTVVSRRFFDMYSYPRNGILLWGGIGIGYAF